MEDKSTILQSYYVAGLSMSKERGQLLKALSLFKRDMKPIIKDRTVSFNNVTYQYATRDEVLLSIAEPLDRYGLILEQPIHTDSNGVTRLSTILTHIESEQFIHSSVELLFMLTKVPDLKSFGGACTYESRYAICMLLGLAQEDYDGNEKEHVKNNKPKPVIGSMITKTQLKDLNDVLRVSDTTGEVKRIIIQKTNVTDFSKLTQKQYEFIEKDIISRL